MNADAPEVWIAIAALIVAAVAALVAFLLHRRQRTLERQLRVLWAGKPTDATAVLAQQAERITSLEHQLTHANSQDKSLRDDLQQMLQHVAVVRYDAFGDMGGRLSFSVALLDDHGDGVVFSAIHARGDSRTYAKGIVQGRSDVTLTPEEQQALAAARERD